MDSATIESASAAIMRYLHDHPDSADTVEGVAEWWLARQRIVDTLPVVSEALDRLTTIGSLRRQQTVDGRCIYTLAPNGKDH